jgi:hypothetical protein
VLFSSQGESYRLILIFLHRYSPEMTPFMLGDGEMAAAAKAAFGIWLNDSPASNFQTTGAQIQS